jgi:hypothetical protein
VATATARYTPCWHIECTNTQALESSLGYAAQPPPQAVQQPARSGRNNALLGANDDVLHGHGQTHTHSFLAVAGGGGLLAGALLTEGFEHHENREEERSYDQGYDQGQLSFVVPIVIV